MGTNTELFDEAQKNYRNLLQFNEDLRKRIPTGWYIQSMDLVTPGRALRITWRRNHGNQP